MFNNKLRMSQLNKINNKIRFVSIIDLDGKITLSKMKSDLDSLLKQSNEEKFCEHVAIRREMRHEFEVYRANLHMFSQSLYNIYVNVFIHKTMEKELIPFSIDSFPKEGPIISDWIISADAGNLPALNTFAKSIASFNEKSRSNKFFAWSWVLSLCATPSATKPISSGLLFTNTAGGKTPKIKSYRLVFW